MSQKRHSPSSEIAHMIAEVRRMNSEQIMETYGIKLLEDGKVLDTMYDKQFKNVPDWAAWVVDENYADHMYYDEDDDYEDEDY